MSYHNDNTKSKQTQLDILTKNTEKKKKTAGAISVGGYLFTEGTKARMNQCGYFLELATDITQTKKRTMRSYNCKSPWCPRCRWLKARKDALRIAILMKYIQQVKDKRFFLLTLTAPNVKADKLSKEITRFNTNFQKLLKRKELLPIVKGYIRKLEVTYNLHKFITRDMWYGNSKKYIKSQAGYFTKRGLKIGDLNPNYDTYHPHFHVLGVVDKSYFTDNRKYLRRDEWLILWQEVMGDKTITQMDVRTVKEDLAGQKKEGEEEPDKVVCEVAKYTAKDTDFMISPSVFEVFYLALAGRQTTTYSGLFAEANKLYKQKKLDYLKDKDTTNYVYSLLYQWQKDGEYLLTDMRELSEKEKAKLKGQSIEEAEILDDD